MQLQDLHVYHLKKKEETAPAPGHSPLPFLPFLNAAPGFNIATCQRQVWVFGTRQHDFLLSEQLEYSQGQDAYLFLLRFICGLESEILGETDVFGQFKDAWQKFKAGQTPWGIALAPWIQRLFEDTKEIRSQHLQNLGGVSYGSLIRRLLKDRGDQVAPGSSLLLVGAGQIAHSIAPYLVDFELLLTNRSPERLSRFHDLLVREHAATVRSMLLPVDQKEAWNQAKTVVICTPCDPIADQRWISWFLEGPSVDRRVIHLGGLRHECGVWTQLPSFFALDDLFGFQNSLGNHRTIQISYAERACEERAKLRALGNSLSISHGWEDLACFA
jgi:hypothetical protein